MNIYLIRHAQTNLNGQKRFIGYTDETLSEAGKKQAKALAEVFKDKQIDVIYCSPLIRAKETALAIAKSQTKEPPVIFKDGLKEVGFGNWEKLTYLEAYQINPEINEWLLNPSKVQIPGGEKWHDFKSRVKSAFEEISKSEMDNICIVCHSGPLRLIIGNIIYPKQELSYLSPNNIALYHGSITCIEKIENNFYIKSLNEVCHLKACITQLQPAP